jgi:hypothetical protein
MWKRLQSSWMELRLRLKSMSNPWLYDKVSKETLTPYLIKEDTNANT